MVDSHKCVRLADFGLAVIEDGGSSVVPSCGGAVAWLAPELLDPEAYGLCYPTPTRQSDVYSFGCVCVEVRPPFDCSANPPVDSLTAIFLPSAVCGAEGRTDNT